MNDDELKITYPSRNQETEEPIDFTVDDEELFDCYVRSDTE